MVDLFFIYKSTRSSDMVKRLGRIDVLLVPVGGLYTIDANVANVKKAVNPKICIPMQ